ncbi:MAG: dTDP-4-dehydrorhamnose reductase [Hyphomicrobiaceae bacterium]
MRILVAGWHGQVARALSELVATRTDIQAYAVGRPALDLSDSAGISRTLFGISPDIIINTAGYTDVDGAEAEPLEALRYNSVGAASLAARAHANGIPIIHLSSALVFDGVKTEPYIEEDAPRPINAYGRSKLASESAVAQANPQHIVLRTAWIYSQFGSNFVKSMLRRAGEGKPIELVNDEFGSPTYALHLADAIFRIAAHVLEHPGPNVWGTYHVAGDGGASWFELAQRTFDVSGALGGPSADLIPISQVDYPSRAARPLNVLLDGGKLERVFGIALPQWRDGVDDCVRKLLNV